MSVNITMDMIKDLRERTGVGMAKCKEALVIGEGDMQKAMKQFSQLEDVKGNVQLIRVEEV